MRQEAICVVLLVGNIDAVAFLQQLISPHQHLYLLLILPTFLLELPLEPLDLADLLSAFLIQCKQRALQFLNFH